MNGMLSTRIAQFNTRYLEKVETCLAFHAGGATQLRAMEAVISHSIESFQELIAQYRMLHRVGEICRTVESELEDYSEMAYCSDGEVNGIAFAHEEETYHIGIRDLLDERFAYVRAIYGDGILTF